MFIKKNSTFNKGRDAKGFGKGKGKDKGKDLGKEKRAPRGAILKKDCAFCKKKLDIDYKNLELLGRYVSGKGRIVSRRINGNCAKHQRGLCRQIKLARFLSLLPSA